MSNRTRKSTSYYSQKKCIEILEAFQNCRTKKKQEILPATRAQRLLVEQISQQVQKIDGVSFPAGGATS